MTPFTEEDVRTRTKQQWFDLIWARAQDPVKAEGPRAGGEGETRCVYDHSAPGGGCFVGCGLTKGQSNKADTAGWSADNLPNHWFINTSLISFLQEAQRIHDGVPPNEWLTHLRILGKCHNLKVPR